MATWTALTKEQAMGCIEDTANKMREAIVSPLVSIDEILNWMEQAKSEMIVEYREAGCNYRFEATTPRKKNLEWGQTSHLSNPETLSSEYALRTMALLEWMVPVSKMLENGLLSLEEQSTRKSPLRGEPYLVIAPTK